MIFLFFGFHQKKQKQNMVYLRARATKKKTYKKIKHFYMQINS